MPFKQEEDLCLNGHVIKKEAYSSKSGRGTVSLDIPMVGQRHQRETRLPQGSGRQPRAVPDRISGQNRSGRSSVNYQQSIQASQSAKNYHSHSLGTLSFRGTASQGNITQDIYPIVVTKWILPRWGKHLLEQI